MSQSNFAKGRERWHMQRFKECYPGIAKMETISSENPDFILQDKSGSIGIEHRRIVKPSDEKGFNLKQEEQVHEKAVNLACEKFFKSTEEFVEVTISFASRTKINAENLAPRIAEIVKDNIPEEGSFKLLKKYDDNLNKVLPDEISKIRIFKSASLDGNYWTFDGGGFETELKPELIQKAIDDKNQKLPNYREIHPECNEYWLLLVIHGFRPSSWFEIPDSLGSTGFEYDFDKVFLFDVQKRNYFDFTKK
ncbi:hypothetical protein NC796_10840 [Aliifodinibius sp. S!AR15-10]|uniref:hypothetical protein n=1 Tax=Aliifodinibius sp. S!AR15-10 TaxID=2950437 RepID=UPI00285BADB6|nr:hypothetical protein [Aliifodinibius sp. S!AR15-10]MDR8391640.1 hypothetical protein [Aliifodinibius sp. S!AR15-10]